MRWSRWWLFAVVAMVCAGPGAGTAAAVSTSTSAKPAGALASAAALPLARAAAEGDSATIAFDDYSLGTSITDDYAAHGVVFTSDVFLSDDDANPTAPVLSGTPKFFGDIVGHFTVPGTTTPATVNGFTLDVGYINDRNSVEIEYYDSAGTVVGSTRAQSLGINRIEVAYRGVAGFKVSAVTYEAAGFAIDNLVVRRGAAGIKPQRVAALGDSYSSGEGLQREKGLRYDCGTDLQENRYYENTTLAFSASWMKLWSSDRHCDTLTGSTRRPKDLDRRRLVKYRNLCHRHRRAYSQQIQAAFGVAGDNGLFVACSSARTEHIGVTEPTAVQHPDSPNGIHGGETQIANVDQFVKDRGAPDLVMIGIGGNDAGFRSIIEECAWGSCDRLEFMSPTISTVQGSVYHKVRATLEGLRQRVAPATVVAFGYPSVIDEPQSCSTRAPGIGDGEWKWIKEALLPTLNDTIKDAAAAAGVVYVDITRATADHGICSGDPWINGLEFGDDNWGVGNESFHPNQKAHDAIAKLFVDHYTDGAGTLLVTNPPADEAIRPPGGSEIDLGDVDVSPVRQCGADCLQPAACVQACQLHVRGGGFAPGATLQAVLHSDPVSVGSVTANAAGEIDATLAVPAGLAPGDHTLSLDGVAADGTQQHSLDSVRVHKRLGARIVAKASASRRGARVRKLSVRRLPAGARVRIACGKGVRAVGESLAGLGGKRRARQARRRGCPFPKRSFAIRRAARQRKFSKHFKRRLAPGTVVRIVVTKPGLGGRSLDLRVRRGKRAKVKRQCIQPGGAVLPLRC